ncbi:hypothetical protein [Spiroplasma mirum]|uniref:hypothetical protein n=1 Tax=Spiroplasma mirum TaxID=2144 RepID=UPI0011DE4188|nr:hypothetical protein [Spiroplasma atrichopogonis]
MKNNVVFVAFGWALLIKLAINKFKNVPINKAPINKVQYIAIESGQFFLNWKMANLNIFK